jgi:hypothetical protein
MRGVLLKEYGGQILTGLVGKLSREKQLEYEQDKDIAGYIRMKKPRPIFERGLPKDRKPHYLFLLLDALSGLIFALTVLEAEATCEAKLQLPTFHFKEGSGYAVQYQADENSTLRLQPLHCSTISWQIPPL